MIHMTTKRKAPNDFFSEAAAFLNSEGRAFFEYEQREKTVNFPPKWVTVSIVLRIENIEDNFGDELWKIYMSFDVRLRAPPTIKGDKQVCVGSYLLHYIENSLKKRVLFQLGL